MSSPRAHTFKELRGARVVRAATSPPSSRRNSVTPARDS